MEMLLNPFWVDWIENNVAHIIIAILIIQFVNRQTAKKCNHYEEIANRIKAIDLKLEEIVD